MYTKTELLAQLHKMNAPRDRVVLMHSSLRTVGDVEGGGQGLLDTLIEYFTAEGGLFCVPTHTWGNVGKADRVTLDLNVSENNLGAFSQIAAADARGVRSENPTHSMVVFGDRAKAETFVRDDAYITSPTAPNSCYGKIYEQGGFIFLVGVSQNRNTYLHCVAEMLQLPNRMAERSVSVSVRRTTGEIVRRELAWYDQVTYGDVSLRFPKYELPFRYHGAITDGFLGDAPTQLCDAVIMKDTVERIFQRCEGKDPLRNEAPIPPKWYCGKASQDN